MSVKESIGWCDMTRNYVWGCNRGCEYCYARRIARRFAKEIARKEANFLTKSEISRDDMNQLIADWMSGSLEKNKYLDWFKVWMSIFKRMHTFEPTFLESHYAQPLPKKPQRIFLDSMSDIADWKEEWYEKILQKITENFQHTFIILTKRPEIYKKYIFPYNVWLGVTITNFNDYYKNYNNLRYLNSLPNKWFFSFEPIRDIEIHATTFSHSYYPDWIIVGPETGIKIKSEDGLKKIINSFYDIKGIPIYMKSGCSKIIDTPLRQEWPEI